MSNSTSCINPPATAMTDSGVAGSGVLLAFVITAGIALILSVYIILGDFRTTAPVTPKVIARKLLNSFSDQQIVEGIGIQAVGLAKIDSIVPYHFFIIWMLSLLSTATHLATLLALVEDYKRDWVLRWLRQFFMFVNLLLNVLYGIFVLETSLRNLSPTLPMSCVWIDHANSTKASSQKVLSVVGTLAVIVFTCVLFALSTWYLHMRRQRWGRMVRTIGLFLLIVTAIGAAVRVIIASQAFGTPSVRLSGPDEREWSFGQLLGMLMLILPLISALEIFRGEINVPVTINASDDEQPLNELKSTREDYYSYQPNPILRRK